MSDDTLHGEPLPRPSPPKPPRNQRSISARPRSNSLGPGLRRYITPVDHIDGLVVDEHDHDPHLDAHLEDADDDDNDASNPVPDAPNGVHGGKAQLEEPVERCFLQDGNDESTYPTGGKYGNDDTRRANSSNERAADAEKGQAGFIGGESFNQSRSRTRGTISRRSGSGKDVWQDPKTRKWKDDIVTFNTTDDPENPKNWPPRKKLRVLILYGLSTMCATFASSVFSSASSYYAAEYGITDEVAILGVSLFVLGYVPGPLIFAPISTIFGRKLSILPPLFIFICFSAATATAENIQTIFITRFFAGVMAAAPVTCVGGVLADMYNQRDRGAAVVLYSLAVVAGPTIGPIIGGAVSQSYLGWRWTEYLTIILTAVVLIADIFFIPETFAPYILTQKAKHLRKETGRWALHSQAEMKDTHFKVFVHQNLALPIRMVATEPMVTVICLYNSLTYGVLYMLFSFIPLIYEDIRGWNTLVGALPFLSVFLGCLTAAGINLAYAHLVFAPHLDRHGGKAAPEMRLPPMMIGSILFPVGFFIVGWTSKASIQWFPSLVGFYFIGTSFLLIFQAGLNYLIDTYTSRSASAVAANTFLRSLFAVGLPFAVQPMVAGIGIDWSSTLLGLVGCLMACFPFLFWKFGPRLRAMSKLTEKVV
ncbi:MFS transporter, DHA1 family, multidrug resistance protein, partial [Tremellales sp. Uapishka_1]